AAWHRRADWAQAGQKAPRPLSNFLAGSKPTPDCIGPRSRLAATAPPLSIATLHRPAGPPVTKAPRDYYGLPPASGPASVRLNNARSLHPAALGYEGAA